MGGIPKFSHDYLTQKTIKYILLTTSHSNLAQTLQKIHVCNELGDLLNLKQGQGKHNTAQLGPVS